MTSTYAVKGKAKQFLHKLFDKEDKPTNNDTIPVPQEVSNITSRTSTDFVQSFNALALSDQPRVPLDPGFIGGFSPHYAPAPRPYLASVPDNIPDIAPGPLPRPPPMPLPHTPHAQQSLTMQMALRPENDSEALHLSSSSPSLRPHFQFVPVIPSFGGLSPSSTASTSGPVQQANPVSPFKKNKRPRASSTLSAASTSAATRQCAGVTKAGKRCIRQVKLGPALSQAYDDDDGEDIIERFCFQHTKEVLAPSGYYSRKHGEWISFEDWIPPYLQPDTQVALRVEMEKSRSQSDVPGYIYTFEIRENKAAETIKLKVGRAVNLVKRIDQWGKQCGSKEQVLRGWYPGTVVEPYDDGTGVSLLKGRVIAGKKGAWCHRLERLVHLELADLATTAIYLNPLWPRVQPSSGLTKMLGNPTDTHGQKQSCPDCGTIHKEIFEFVRVKKGPLKGKEWESVVQPVIERWGKFVDDSV